MRISSPGRPRDPFSTALDTLRRQLRGGRMILGEPLTITDLAQGLGLSATPVREALSRLAGEGLIEDRRGRGYFARRIDVADLVELYGLRGLYLAGALKSAAGGFSGLDAPVHSDMRHPSATMEQLFDSVMARAGNRALLDAYRLVADRLAPATAAEGGVFSLEADLGALETALAGADPCTMERVILDLHLDRQIRAGELVRAMRARMNIATL